MQGTRYFKTILQKKYASLSAAVSLQTKVVYTSYDEMDEMIS